MGGVSNPSGGGASIFTFTVGSAMTGSPNYIQHDSNKSNAELLAQAVVPRDLTVTKLTVKPVANTRDGASTVTLRKNGADTALTLSIPASSTAKVSASGLVSFAEGDLLSIQVAWGGTTGSLQLSAGVEISP